MCKPEEDRGGRRKKKRRDLSLLYTHLERRSRARSEASGNSACKGGAGYWGSI